MKKYLIATLLSLVIAVIVSVIVPLTFEVECPACMPSASPFPVKEPLFKVDDLLLIPVVFLITWIPMCFTLALGSLILFLRRK